MKKTSTALIAAHLALAGVLLTHAVVAHSAEPVTAKALAELQRRITDGQFSRAYDLAKTMPSAQGDPHFDFLYGVAAVNVGRTAEAVLALQRHLAVVPGNDRARLDLARAYFELGDYARARQEFEFVLRYNPPADVRANISRYLDSMQTRESLTGRNNARMYAEVGYGPDSNANLGTHNNVVLGSQIDPASKGQSSQYGWLAAGGRWVRQVSPPFGVFAGADFDNKLNQDTPQYNTNNFTAYSGFTLVSGPVLYRLAVSDTISHVNNVRYSSRPSATGEMQYAMGDGLSLSGRLQYAEQTYGGDNSTRDATVGTLGVGAEQAFSGSWRPTVGLQLSQAHEDNINKRPDLGRVMDTWRLSVNLNPTDKVGVMLAYSEQDSNYQAADMAFNTVRRDNLAIGDLVVSYALDNNWTLRLDLQQSENKSNQSLYAYHRVLGGIKLRYSY